MSSLYNSKDTIAALATPIGVGGIAVIRISGEQSFSIVDSLFSGGIKIQEADSHTVHFGKIRDRHSTVLDTVLVTVFRSPHSYTGEDVVEISLHGGYFISQMVLNELYAAGARPALPGEFTFRAFLNGKLDLSQAEAVADIIHSKSEKSHKASLEQLSGKLSKHINDLRTQLLNLCSLLELELDFSQEGIELTKKDELLEKLQSIEVKITSMIESYSEGKLAREGVRVALVGKPNTGKSSLLNILLEEERAIVSDIPGTTRDVIEESIILEGLEFIFTDTAGLRESSDLVEQEGIRRTILKLQNADVVLFIVDSSVPHSSEDVKWYNEIFESINGRALGLFVVNKIDIRAKSFNPKLFANHRVVEISCVTHEGIQELKKLLVDIVLPHHDSSVSSIIITNIRHKQALESAKRSLQNAKASIINGMSGEFIAVDLRDALNYLGEIIGLTTSDDILNNIFSKFCIGK